MATWAIHHCLEYVTVVASGPSSPQIRLRDSCSAPGSLHKEDFHFLLIFRATPASGSRDTVVHVWDQLVFELTILIQM